MIRKLIKAYLQERAKKKIGKNSIAQTDTMSVSRFAHITLYHKSRPEDIVIEGNVLMYGSIISEFNGKVRIGRFSQLGSNSTIRAVNSVTIGPFTAISNNVHICDNNNHSVSPQDRMIVRQTLHGSYERSWNFSDSAPILIGRNCWIGENSRICKGVIIGDGSIVAANAVVTKSVPANCIVAGNPAKIVKTDIDKTDKRYFNDGDYPNFERY